ncbi:MAG: UbiA family prenyltransferase [Planctomycetota bacterium]
MSDTPKHSSDDVIILPPRRSPEGLHAPPRATLLTWLQLMRLPTVFTAFSNILCGYFITHAPRISDLPSSRELWCLLASTFGLYLGGMVLNDVFDAKLDAVERPERPIPSGRIPRKAATILGVLLTTVGVLSAACVGIPSVCIALLIVPAVVIYNGFLKSTIAAAPGMAACRFLNLMLGASAVSDIAGLWNPVPLCVATGLSLYIFGVTVFARNEAGAVKRSGLVAGVFLLLCGLGIDAWTVSRSASPENVIRGSLMALLLFGLNIMMRVAAVISKPSPRLVQRTVGLMLLSIIFLDAIIVFALTGNSRLAVLTIALVAPASLLKRFIPMS